jgi:hypothetical protein
LAPPPYEERIIDQLKTTAMHNCCVYVGRPAQTLVAKLASGVLSQDVGNDLRLLLLTHGSPLLRSTELCSSSVTNETARLRVRAAAGPFKQLRSHSEDVIEAKHIHQ